MRGSALAAVVVATLGLSFGAASHEGHRNNDVPAATEAAKGAEGASSVDAGATDGPVATSADMVVAAAPADFDAADYLGRLHPAVVHFPIALLLAAALAELLLILRPASGLGVVVRFLTWTGAAGAVTATALGWFAGGFRLTDRHETLAYHRWNGSAVAALSLLAAMVASRAERRTFLRIPLAALSAAIVWQGWLGGELTHGEGHLAPIKEMTDASH